jgi:hypothetical protein
MTRYLISFGAHAMDHIPGEEVPAVGKAAHAVVPEAVDAGVRVFGGGLENQRASIVATDGTVTGGPYPEPSAGSGSSMSFRVRRRWRGRPSSPWPAAARKRSGNSCPTPGKTRCSARLAGDGAVPGDV